MGSLFTLLNAAFDGLRDHPELGIEEYIGCLPECKTKAVNFLASGAFIDDERYIPMICAAGSADSRITSIADDGIKRSNVDLENNGVVSRCMTRIEDFSCPSDTGPQATL